MGKLVRPAFSSPTVAIAFFWSVTSLLVAGASAQSWREGNAFRKALQSTTPFTLQNPARESLTKLSEAWRMAIFIDRRIDPSQQLVVTATQQPMEEGLKQIAATLKADVCYLDCVVYFGPPGATDRIATMAAVKRAEARKLPPAAAKIWLHREPWSWGELASPRELLTYLAEHERISIQNVAEVPHDLWPAVDLPPLRLVDRFALVLAGFDLTLDIDAKGTTARIVPIPEKVELVKDYTHSITGAQLRQLRGQYSDATIQRLPRGVRVRGTLRVHTAIERIVRGEPKVAATNQPVELRFHIEVKEKPLGAVLKKIVQDAELEVSITNEATPALQQRVSFRVQDATLHQLLEATIDGTGLTFQLDGTRLLISHLADVQP